MMGAGLLAIPHGFSESGLVLGIVGFMLVGVICAFSVYLLIEVRLPECSF
jgi:amino acid permease